MHSEGSRQYGQILEDPVDHEDKNINKTYLAH
jgi:hypothetical protein